jgi:aspartyl-tRNA(Asn)/glutamyl-tRNA(Gln) amidotransferase subunit B
MSTNKEVVTGSGAPHWSMKYELVVGLEVHAQLITATKAYSTDPNAYGDHPNTNVSVLTLGHPGTLPVANKKVIEHAIRLGLATNCSIASWMHYARKNYFYPDLPKGYQITQDKTPICVPKVTLTYRIRGTRTTRTEPEPHRPAPRGSASPGSTWRRMQGKSIHDVDPFNTLGGPEPCRCPVGGDRERT